MKILLISAAVILALVGLITLFFSFKSKDIEMPKYKLIKTIDGIEIRQYPKMLVAQTNMADSSMDKNMNSGFRTIAGYIFGGNERNQKIAMTAPVVFKMGDTASMYFVMPSKYKKEDLPNPNSTQVKIMEEREKVLAVITYSGFSSPKLVEKHQQKLMSVLQQNQIKTIGSYLYMGYNAPWDFVNRRNEVAIEVVL